VDQLKAEYDSGFQAGQMDKKEENKNLKELVALLD
jgi:hypothetical protein